MKLVVLLANKKSEIFESCEYATLFMARQSMIFLSPEDLFPLPKGSKLFYITDTIHLGLNHAGITEKIYKYRPVAAFLTSGYTIRHLTAFRKTNSTPKLHLWSYTVVA